MYVLNVRKNSYSCSKGSFMNKEQYAGMLKDIRETHKQGHDVSACIAKYKEQFKYIYIYNDSIFKLLFGTPENESIAIDFLNATLGRIGSDCIDNLIFNNLTKEETTNKSNEDKKQQLECISIGILHENEKSYSKQTFYTRKRKVTNKHYGDSLWTQDFSHIELQLSDDFTDAKNYRHCGFFEHEDKQYSNLKQSITFIEVSKFLKGNYIYDQSTLAQWLRFIDSLNKETPIETLKDYIFSQLEEKAKLCNFTKDFLISEAMKMNNPEN